MYLPEEAVEETLPWVAAQAPGSIIIFDFVGAALIKFMATADLSKFPEAAQKAFDRLRRLTAGEPWIFGLPDTGEREFLVRLGLELLHLLPVGGPESMKRYMTRSDGRPYIEIPPPQQQAQSQRGGYCLAEAVVPGPE
jgi:O-methyltransferase involved in polyketide biosynthesis